MNIVRFRFAVLFAFVVPVACDRAGEITHSGAAAGAAPPAVYSAEGIALRAEEAQIEPRMVRSARGQVEVRDLNEAVASFGEMVRSVNGVIAESERTSNADVTSANFLARIPSDSLDSLINRLASLGEVQSIAMSSTDVSREYFDADTRLAVKEATVRRLTQLIERASRIEDVVAVERELSRTTAELESLKGQLTYFDRKVAESELHLYLSEPGNAFGGATLRTVTHAFRNATSVLADSIASLVYFIAFVILWLALGVILWPVGKWSVRRLRRRAVLSE